MPSIEIPLPDFRVEYEFDYDYTDYEITDRDVKFTLVFGGYKVAEKTYSVPMYDTDDYYFNDRRDEFNKYVAERMERLFS